MADRYQQSLSYYITCQDVCVQTVITILLFYSNHWFNSYMRLNAYYRDLKSGPAFSRLDRLLPIGPRA